MLWRPVLDTALAITAIGTVFAAGALHRQVQEHDEQLRRLSEDRGAVRISMEADTRLTALETIVSDHGRAIVTLTSVQADLAEIRAGQSEATRRLERIERKLDR